MTTIPFSHSLPCSCCGRDLILYEHEDFKAICAALLVGETGLVICTCGHVSRIRLVDSGLVQLPDDEQKKPGSCRRNDSVTGEVVGASDPSRSRVPFPE